MDFGSSLRAGQRVRGGQRKAASPGAMKPASRLELSRGPLAAPLEGIIVGSSNIGDTKDHAARCGVASTAGVHNSFHDALRQGQRVVDTYRTRPASTLTRTRLCCDCNISEGPPSWTAFTPDGSRSGLRQQHRAGKMPSRIIAELRRLADDDEEEQGVLPMLAQVQKRAERVVAERICVPGPCRLGGHLP